MYDEISLLIRTCKQKILKGWCPKSMLLRVFMNYSLSLTREPVGSASSGAPPQTRNMCFHKTLMHPEVWNIVTMHRSRSSLSKLPVAFKSKLTKVSPHTAEPPWMAHFHDSPPCWMPQIFLSAHCFPSHCLLYTLLHLGFLPCPVMSAYPESHRIQCLPQKIPILRMLTW